MRRRKNGSGTLYLRGEVWYAKIKVGGRVLRLSTGETNRRRAVARLDVMAQGFDLSDDARLAAVAAALKPNHREVKLADAWGLYCTAPRNQGQSDHKRRCDDMSWRRFTGWLHGAPRRGERKAMLAAHPNVKTLDGVTERIAAQFVAEMRGRYSPKTIVETLKVCRRMWRLCGVEPNPWLALPPIRTDSHLRKAFTDDELRRIVGAADGELRTLLLVGAYTGLRLSDAATLRWEQITPDLGAVILKPHKTARSSGRVVAVPIHPSLKAALGTHGGEGSVMPGLAAAAPCRRVEIVQTHLRRCGFETTVKVDGYSRRVADYGFHSLRSTFVTRLADAGMPLAQLRGLVGHVSVEMTQHYYRQDAEAARATLETLPALG